MMMAKAKKAAPKKRAKTIRLNFQKQRQLEAALLPCKADPSLIKTDEIMARELTNRLKFKVNHDHVGRMRRMMGIPSSRPGDGKDKGPSEGKAILSIKAVHERLETLERRTALVIDKINRVEDIVEAIARAWDVTVPSK